MIDRRVHLAWPWLGLLLGIGCGGGRPELHLDPATDASLPAQGDDAESDGALDAIDDAVAAGDDSADAFDDGARDEAVREKGTPTTRDSVASDDQGAETGLDGASACGPSPWVLVGAVPNVRQLAGVPLAGGGAVTCDRIYRGSSLASLTADGCERLAATGIRTVIDLRSVAEQSSPPATCVLQQSKLVSAPLPVPSSVSPADYLAILYSAPSMRAIFEILADEASYPIYYNCLYGRDRTGVVTAVILFALGASRAVIQQEYALTADAGLAVYPASLDAVLDEIEGLGGIDAYFRAIGVPPEQVEAVRKILAPPPTTP